jgi:anti-sigma B factor antagonist
MLDHLRASEHTAGRKPIPLLRDNTNHFDQPEINIAVTNDGSLASLCGRIDIESSPAVRERLLALLHASDRKMLRIDLSAVTDIDSSGVATLIEALRIARGNKTELRLQGLHDRVLRLFEITGILSLFTGSAETLSQSGYEAV